MAPTAADKKLESNPPNLAINRFAINRISSAEICAICGLIFFPP